MRGFVALMTRTTPMVFQYQANSDETLAGVYEHDDDVGYFYLSELTACEGQRIVGAVQVFLGPFRHALDDLAIRWSFDGHVVALFVKGELCAAFDATRREAFGGDSGKHDAIPQSMKHMFTMH
jgi:hypothetical protein